MARETDLELPDLKGLPRWARGESAIVFKKKEKKRGRAGVKELKKQNISHPRRAEYSRKRTITLHSHEHIYPERAEQ